MEQIDWGDLQPFQTTDLATGQVNGSLATGNGAKPIEWDDVGTFDVSEILVVEESLEREARGEGGGEAEGEAGHEAGVMFTGHYLECVANCIVYCYIAVSILEVCMSVSCLCSSAQHFCRGKGQSLVQFQYTQFVYR